MRSGSGRAQRSWGVCSVTENEMMAVVVEIAQVLHEDEFPASLAIMS